MSEYQTPVIFAPSKVASALDSLCSSTNSLEMLENTAQVNDLNDLPLTKSREWLKFSSEVRKAFIEKDHVVIKGLPVNNRGATLLIVSKTVGSMFRTYRGGQIVKHFKMSPWTRELSHTTKEGEFHTDLNTEIQPPALTAMQCLDPDPGAPQYGISRVARLKDILLFLEQNNNLELLKFLTESTVSMLNDRSSASWSGSIVEDDIIRYHPETLRAAKRRFDHQEPFLEDKILSIAQAAMKVSEPFILEAGDVLLLSNHRTLHYRGECSVMFKHYPTDFLSRSIFILHMNRERKPDEQ